jgi:phage head maturation protease
MRSATQLGSADPAKSYETPDRVVLVGRLNIENSAVASHVRDLLKNGEINGWSFGYKVIRQRRAKDATELLQLDINEAGPCVSPANRRTRTLGVKSEQLPQEPDKVPSTPRLRGTSCWRASSPRLSAPPTNPSTTTRG